MTPVKFAESTLLLDVVAVPVATEPIRAEVPSHSSYVAASMPAPVENRFTDTVTLLTVSPAPTAANVPNPDTSSAEEIATGRAAGCATATAYADPMATVASAGV